LAAAGLVATAGATAGAWAGKKARINKEVATDVSTYVSTPNKHVSSFTAADAEVSAKRYGKDFGFV
jgi:hypothetical protein